MKKIFTIFAAMLVAMTVSATTRPITPGTDKLKAEVAAADPGDVIELADGIYYEEGNFDMKKNLTIKAAADAHPIIANLYYFRVEGGADITFKGLIFDGALYAASTKTGASDHCVRSYSASTGAEDVIFEDCEFRNYPSYVLYTQRPARKWNSVTIRNCYFHDNAKHGVAIMNDQDTKTSCAAVTIENSTFVGPTSSSSYNAIIIQDKNETSLSVNKCTFYNSKASFISAGSDVTTLAVSNCIFANPSSKSFAPVSLSAGTLSNCLSYNTGSWATGENITNTSCISGNPLFRTAASNNFTLNYGSPAYEAGTEGSDIGDPDWVQTAHTVYCKMEYSWWTDGGAAIGAFATVDAGETQYNKAFPGVRMTPGEDNTWSISLAPKYRYVKFARMNPSDEGNQNWGAETSQLTIPNSKYNFYTITSSTAQWKSQDKTVDGNWSMYPAPDNTKIQLVGEMNGWSSNDFFTIADGGLTASYDIYLGKNGDGYNFKIIKGDKMYSIDNAGYWFTRANNSAVVEYYNESSNPCLVNVDLAGQYTFTWTYATNTLTITYPQPVHADGYYLVGKFYDEDSKKQVEMWNVENCVASKKLTVDPLDAGLYTVIAKLTENDQIKVVKVQNDAITTWYPDGNDNEYVMTSDQAGDAKVVNFRPAKDGPASWWYNYLYVADNGGGTAIDDVIDSEKAVKTIENGQLVIIKNGVRYNVLGTAVK